jgi:hypothetical protein
MLTLKSFIKTLYAMTTLLHQIRSTVSHVNLNTSHQKTLKSFIKAIYAKLHYIKNIVSHVNLNTSHQKNIANDV